MYRAHKRVMKNVTVDGDRFKGETPYVEFVVAPGLSPA